jgi:hypothetical protein
MSEAIRLRYIEKAEVLLGLGASARAVDQYGNSTLNELLVHGLPGSADLAPGIVLLRNLIRLGVSVNERNQAGFRPIEQVQGHNREPVRDYLVLKELIKTGADLTTDNGHKPLISLYIENPHMILALLRAGAPIMDYRPVASCLLTDILLFTPNYQKADFCVVCEILRDLIARGCDPSEKDPETGQSPLEAVLPGESHTADHLAK